MIIKHLAVQLSLIRSCFANAFYYNQLHIARLTQSQLKSNDWQLSYKFINY